ncbi:MAG: M23 family metallopeptidase [Spirochaetes bacterium]|nr:M23 family metallopeptidase [Spirochaetota bacterium]
MNIYKPFAIITALVLLSSFALSFQWPVTNGTIHSTFGEPRPDHFHNGVDISSIDKKVFPVKEGNLVFCWDKSLFPLEQYPGVGNYCILEHQKNEKSVYVHLDNSLNIQKRYQLTDTIAYMGNTGRSYGTHLHFTVLSNGNVSINPFTILPQIDDKKPPVIEGIYIKVGDSYTRLREGSNIRLTQHHPLAIQCFDAIKRNERCGIFALKVIMNNATILDVRFDTIKLDNKNKLTIKAIGFENLYDSKGNYIATNVSYNSGINSLTVIAEDFAGNKTSQSVNFNVVLDFKK